MARTAIVETRVMRVARVDLIVWVLIGRRSQRTQRAARDRWTAASRVVTRMAIDILVLYVRTMSLIACDSVHYVVSVERTRLTKEGTNVLDVKANNVQLLL